jgi:predicted site-specific integrase-resolvase
MKRVVPTDLIGSTKACDLISVSRPTMARLLKDGTIQHFTNPLDKREKLVSRSEVLALKPQRAEAA